jgi:hypothetical protein
MIAPIVYFIVFLFLTERLVVLAARKAEGRHPRIGEGY